MLEMWDRSNLEKLSFLTLFLVRVCLLSDPVRLSHILSAGNMRKESIELAL